MPAPAATERLSLELKKIALHRIAEDKLVLPSTPAVAARCLAMLREPGLNMKVLANTIERDPMLAAMVTRLANSAAHGAGLTTWGLAQSVMRLGQGRIKMVLVEACARQVFDSRDKRITEAFKGIWEHSVAVALLARDASALLGGGLDADSAYLSGLLHDVGKPIVGSFLLEAEKMLTAGRHAEWIGSNDWMKTVSDCHRPVGVALVEKWQMPAEIVNCVRDCTEYDPGNRGSIANVVRFANALAKREGIYVGAIDASDVDALVMIGRSLLGLGEDVVARLSANLKDRVRQHISG